MYVLPTDVATSGQAGPSGYDAHKPVNCQWPLALRATHETLRHAIPIVIAAPAKKLSLWRSSPLARSIRSLCHPPDRQCIRERSRSRWSTAPWRGATVH